MFTERMSNILYQMRVEIRYICRHFSSVFFYPVNIDNKIKKRNIDMFKIS